MFFGKTLFSEFLESPERISSNILADRLQKMEQVGLLQKEPYSNHRNRFVYKLTEAGEDFRPILKRVTVWGLKHCENTEQYK